MKFLSLKLRLQFDVHWFKKAQRGVAKFVNYCILSTGLRNTVTKFDNLSSKGLRDKGAHTDK